MSCCEGGHDCQLIYSHEGFIVYKANTLVQLTVPDLSWNRSVPGSYKFTD